MLFITAVGWTILFALITATGWSIFFALITAVGWSILFALITAAGWAIILLLSYHSRRLVDNPLLILATSIGHSRILFSLVSQP